MCLLEESASSMGQGDVVSVLAPGSSPAGQAFRKVVPSVTCRVAAEHEARGPVGYPVTVAGPPRTLTAFLDRHRRVFSWCAGP